MRRLVDGGHVDPARYAQLGLRGYWPGPEVFAWQRERGITTLPAHELRATGLPAGGGRRRRRPSATARRG